MPASNLSHPPRHIIQPLAAQLHALGLRLGANTIKFSVHSALQGTQVSPQAAPSLAACLLWQRASFGSLPSS